MARTAAAVKGRVAGRPDTVGTPGTGFTTSEHGLTQTGPWPRSGMCNPVLLVPDRLRRGAFRLGDG